MSLQGFDMGDYVRPIRSRWEGKLGRVVALERGGASRWDVVKVALYDLVVDDTTTVAFDPSELTKVHPLEVLAEEVELL